MEKDELKKHYTYLNNLLTKFLEGEKENGNGSNETKRKNGLSKMEESLLLFKQYAEHNSELKAFIFAEKYSGSVKEFAWGELCSLTYFGKDMKSILSIMKTKIEQ